MALTLNLTLFIQMIHFIGASLLITRYFLKPGYEVVKSDEESLHQIRTSILYQQKKIAERSLYKYEQWRVCQREFILKRPSVVYEAMKHEPETFYKQIAIPSEEELVTIAQEVTAQIKEQVLDV